VGQLVLMWGVLGAGQGPLGLEGVGACEVLI
jgi:hypothetical protein